MGNKMDLNFNPVETGSLALAIIATAFTLQVKFLPYFDTMIDLLILSLNQTDGSSPKFL